MNHFWKIFFSIVLVIAVGLFLWYFSSIVLYVLIAGVISLIGQPLMNLLGKIKIKNFILPLSVRAIIVLILFGGLFYFAIRISLPVIFSQAEQFSNINLNDLQEKLNVPLSSLDKTLKTYHLQSIDYNQINEYLTNQVKKFIDVSDISNLFSAIFDALGSFLIAFFAIIFITYFFLTDNKLFYNMILFFIPDKYDDRFLKALIEIQHLLSRYFIGVTLESLLLAILRTLSFTFILGIDFKVSLVISLFSGIINVIPYVGNIIGYIFSVIYVYLAYINMDFYKEMIPLIINLTLIYYVIQLIDNILFQPIIYSKSVKAHPLEIFLVILIAGKVGGILGMFLAIPTYTALRVIANEFFSQYTVVRQITKNLNEDMHKEKTNI